MKLGLLITKDEHLNHVLGLVKAAVKKDLQVALFCMDKGTLLVEDSKFKQLCELKGVEISLCRHSAESMGVDTQSLSKDIVCGSQFNNAMMQHESDKVLVI